MIIKKNMETSVKPGFAQIWGGCSPPRPLDPYAYADIWKYVDDTY